MRSSLKHLYKSITQKTQVYTQHLAEDSVGCPNLMDAAPTICVIRRLLRYEREERLFFPSVDA